MSGKPMALLIHTDESRAAKYFDLDDHELVEKHHTNLRGFTIKGIRPSVVFITMNFSKPLNEEWRSWFANVFVHLGRIRCRYFILSSTVGAFEVDYNNVSKRLRKIYNKDGDIDGNSWKR